MSTVTRRCLLVDLENDKHAAAAYDKHHRDVWPEVVAHLRRHGVVAMDIYRLGSRLCMLLETDDRVFDPARKAQDEAEDPCLLAWQTLMRELQVPTPWTPAGQQWGHAQLVFHLRGPEAA